MSMICNLVAISRSRLDELIRQPDRIPDVFFPEEEKDRPVPNLDLDKAWHGVHFLLNGDPWEGDPPLCRVVLGGEPIGEDTGYGPPRYLMPDEVAEVAAALGEVEYVMLSARYDPVAMDEAEIYPHGWAAAPEAGFEWLRNGFDQMAEFYRRAAAKGLAVLLCLS